MSFRTTRLRGLYRHRDGTGGRAGISRRAPQGSPQSAPERQATAHPAGRASASRARHAAGTAYKEHYTDTTLRFARCVNRLHSAAYSHKGRTEVTRQAARLPRAISFCLSNSARRCASSSGLICATLL